MKTKIFTISAVTLALSACSNPYSDWELPNVVRRNQPQPVVQPAPKPTQQVQPEFEKPKAKPQPKKTQQVQPEFEAPKPQPKKAQQVQPEFETPKPQPKKAQQVQPEFEAPKPQPQKAQQVQPELPKPEVKQAPAPKPVVEAPAPKPVAVAAKPKTQVQPTFTQPTRQPVQVQNYTPRPVMTQAQKAQYPVMPGQNRALKRRR